jgi:hypothetical protein
VLALFDEPLTGESVAGDEALPAGTLAEMQALAGPAGSTCDSLAPGHPRQRTLREMASTARLTGYAARKTTLGQAIRADLRTMAAGPQPIEENAQRLYEHILALEALAVELEELRAEFEALWLARAHRSELHVTLGYFASLRARYGAAAAWLEEQRRALSAGEPLDGELATYEVGAHRILWQTWPD